MHLAQLQQPYSELDGFFNWRKPAGRACSNSAEIASQRAQKHGGLEPQTPRWWLVGAHKCTLQLSAPNYTPAEGGIKTWASLISEGGISRVYSCILLAFTKWNKGGGYKNSGQPKAKEGGYKQVGVGIVQGT